MNAARLPPTSCSCFCRFPISEGSLVLFRLARIIVRIDVMDRPWSCPVKLKDRFAFGPDEMLHPSRPIAIGSGIHDFRRFPIEFVPHSDVKSAGNNRDPLGLWVR